MKKQYAPEELIPVLERARSKISNPLTWVKGEWARRLSKDKLAASGGNQLYAYCATGAVGSAVKELHKGTPVREAAVAVLQKQIPREFIENNSYARVEYYNDFTDTTHEEVMELYDRGIKSLKEQVNG